MLVKINDTFITLKNVIKITTVILNGFTRRTKEQLRAWIK